MFDPFARRLSHGLPECGSVLEVACGTGVCTRRIANVLTTGSALIAIDPNESMITLASRKLVSSTSIDWIRAEAENIPFETDSFDVIVCGFGLMFFKDRARAMKEMHRVLMPGGVLRYTVWASQSQNEWIQAVLKVVGSEFPDVEPHWYDAPFSFGEIDRNLSLLDEAGFPEVRLVPVRFALRESDARSLARGFIQGNPQVRALIAEREVSVEKLEARLAAEFENRFGSPIRATMRAFLFESGAVD